MPDLSSLDSQSMLNVVLDMAWDDVSPRQPRTEPGYALWMNMVRLTDKALREYEAARREVGAYVNRTSSNTLSPVFRAVDHLENCIDATHRAILNRKGLRAAGEACGPQRATDRQADLIRLVRNAVEHADEKLIGRQIKGGQPIALAPSDSHVTIGRWSLPYKDLASCITKLYRTVAYMRDVPAS